MTRILLALAFAAALFADGAAAKKPALSEADRAAVAEAEAYLDAIKTLKTDFIQVASGGRRATGKIYLKRPGRMRVEFDPPAELVMVATPIWLIVDDAQSHKPTYIPIRSSPAYILTREKISLNDGRIGVFGVTRTPGQLLIRVAEADDPEGGAIILMFRREDGLNLTGWTVIDDQGEATQVEFVNTETGIELDPDLFLYTNPDYRDPLQIFE